MRWDYRDAQLVRLFPASYACHLVEEWVGGFPEWVSLIAGSAVPRGAFIAINIVAFLVMVLAVRATIRREANGWMAIAIATVLFVNGIAHGVASVVTQTYSPGLITGVVLYLPLGQLALLRAWVQAPPGLFGRGVLTGLAVHALVVLVAYAMRTA